MTYVKLTKKRTKKLSDKANNQEFIRAGIIAELDAVSLYQAHIENTTDEESKHVLTHVMDEEKEHVAELTCLLMKQDPSQEKFLKKRIKTAGIENIDCLHHNEK